MVLVRHEFAAARAWPLALARAGGGAQALARALAVLALALSVSASSKAQTDATVAAASDLRYAVEEVAALFEAETGSRLGLVFGSSGNFKTQILQGAPFHLFMSADERFVDEVLRAGRARDRGRAYAVGRIVIMVPTGSPIAPDGELKDLVAALEDGRLQRFAIAHHDHAPYGARAREALKHVGAWDAIKPRLVLGENVSQAAQFATSGSTQGGIIALSLALAPAVARTGRFELIPEAWHLPLKQRMVLIRGAPPAAQAFYEFLATPAAQEIMKRYGFEMPGE